MRGIISGARVRVKEAWGTDREGDDGGWGDVVDEFEGIWRVLFGADNIL